MSPIRELSVRHNVGGCERRRNCPANVTWSISVRGPGSMLSSASPSSHGLRCRWCVRAENGFHFGFCRYFLAHVQVPVQGSDVFSRFSIVGNGRIAKRVAELQTVIGLRYLVGWSLQTFIFPIEFVDENQFLGSLHYFRSRLARTPSIGGSRAVKKIHPSVLCAVSFATRSCWQTAFSSPFDCDGVSSSDDGREWMFKRQHLV